jgi:acyl-CoA hydrolase
MDRPDAGRGAKRVAESALREQTALVFPNDLNAAGIVFGGRLLEMADRLAGVVARRHSGRECVTLGLDAVRFLGRATLNDMLVLEAEVNRAWRTSMEIGLKAFAEDFRTRERRHIFSAYFTYVGLGEDGRPAEVPGVIAETDEEKRRFNEAEGRRGRRLRGEGS